MPVDDILAGAFIDGGGHEWAPERQLGVRVRRFSLWHRFILKTGNSPIIVGGPVTMLDLQTAVGICRLRYNDTRIRRPRLIPALLGLKAVLQFGKVINEEHPGQRVLKPHLERFLDFCRYYSKSVEYAIIPTESVRGSKPSLPRGRLESEIETVGTIVQWSGWPDRYIWNLPISRAAVYEALALRDQQGRDVDFVTSAERKFQESVPDRFRRSKTRA